MMGRQDRDQGQLFYEFKLDEVIPKNHLLRRVVIAAMVMGLVKGEGFAVDASVMEANASRYHGKAPNELDWTEKQRQKRRWLSICRHSTPKRRLKAMLQMMMIAAGSKVRDSAVMSANRPR